MTNTIEFVCPDAEHHGSPFRYCPVKGCGWVGDGPPKPGVIDVAHLTRQRDFSQRTFGPGARTKGVVDHITKELKEVLDAPDDVSEWVDIIILGFDGALRAGHEPQAIIDAMIAKQAKNEARTWPDWRTMPEDQAIEHDRSAE